MIKKLKLFQTDSEYTAFTGTTAFVKPNVSHCVQEDHVHYNPIPHDYSEDYLTFNILSAGTIAWKASNTATTVATISYSINDGEWTEITSSTAGTSFNVSAGDEVRFKGNNAAYATSTSNYNAFCGSTATFSAEGNIMSLINGDSFSNSTTIENEYAFYELFMLTKIVNAQNLILPAATLTWSCYDKMFWGCTSLTTAPELPATALAGRCYEYMFSGCTSLTTGPSVLPATTLADYCCYCMFGGCRSLTTVPELPATTLSINCYNTMFSGCTSLTTAPELPATTLADYCYQYMFSGCTSLTTGPSVLPATTLTASCYRSMFYGCTSLTTAPVLSATTLEANCYNAMFQGCTRLNNITCLATNKSASNCTKNWVSGVASSGTFYKNPSMTEQTWGSGANGIPSNWTVQDAS